MGCARGCGAFCGDADLASDWCLHDLEDYFDQGVIMLPILLPLLVLAIFVIIGYPLLSQQRGLSSRLAHRTQARARGHDSERRAAMHFFESVPRLLLVVADFRFFIDVLVDYVLEQDTGWRCEFGQIR